MWKYWMWVAFFISIFMLLAVMLWGGGRNAMARGDKDHIATANHACNYFISLYSVRHRNGMS
jgi:hypothetical protein